MSMSFFENDGLSALEAKEQAQNIAFAPMVFQASKCLRDFGLLAQLERATDQGCRLEELVQGSGLSTYSVRVLIEAGLGAGLVYLKSDHESNSDNESESKYDRYFLTKTGYFILKDEMTRTNMDFVHDVCYKGLFKLDAALRQGLPAGLAEFGAWGTIYEGLSLLPQDVQQSWFSFDHFYSDGAFSPAREILLSYQPKNILDIGGNTGKWARSCLDHHPTVEVTLVDLPGQLKVAREQLAQHPAFKRVNFVEMNILETGVRLPAHFDAIWMSQFLDCFSEEQIVHILKLCSASMSPSSRVFILETFWDRQRFMTAAFCLQMTSLYFTALANGCSQMYRSTTFLKCVEDAGLKVEKSFDQLGFGHTLLVLRQK